MLARGLETRTASSRHPGDVAAKTAEALRLVRQCGHHLAGAGHCSTPFRFGIVMIGRRKPASSKALWWCSRLRPGHGQTSWPSGSQAAFTRRILVYLDPRLPIERRVDDLVRRMTLEEKVSQMQNAAVAIPRLGYSGLRLVERRGCMASHGRGTRRCSRRPSGWPRPGTKSFEGSARTTRHRSARQIQPGPARGQSQHLFRPDDLVAEHQHRPRSPLGTRSGNLRRGSVPDRPDWQRVRARPAGERPEYLKDRRDGEALRGPQRAGSRAPWFQCRRFCARSRGYLSAGVPRARDQRKSRERHVCVQRTRRRSCVRQPLRCFNKS